MLALISPNENNQIFQIKTQSFLVNKLQTLTSKIEALN